MIDQLARLAGAAGISTRYWDGLGNRCEVSQETVDACLAAMGIELGTASPRRVARRLLEERLASPLIIVSEGKPWRIPRRTGAGEAAIELEGGGVVDAQISTGGILRAQAPVPPGYHALVTGMQRRTLAMCPAQCYEPDWVKRGEKRWGLAAQLYSLRNAHDEGLGNFVDLAELLTRSGRDGCDAVLINPIAAGFLHDPWRKSPYQPADRRFLNAAMIDVAAAARFLSLPYTADQAVRQPAFIEYTDVVPRHIAALRALYENLTSRKRDRWNEFAHWLENAPEDLKAFARWESGNFQQLGFGDNFEFHVFLQWLADRQLADCMRAAHGSGMSVGLIRDLPVGPAHDGPEKSSQSHAYARNIDVGAPPDLLARDGQNWGIAAFNPVLLRRAGYGPFIALLRANMRHAGGLRIDHVMGLRRLFWIPHGLSGAGGAYVRYPRIDLFALLALESVRAKCLVIGEDLGTVPRGFRRQLKRHGIFSTRLVQFERTVTGELKPPARYPYESVAAVSTHDLPPLRAWWKGLRQSGGREDPPARRGERESILTSLRKFIPGTRRHATLARAHYRDVYVSLLRFLDRTSSALVLVRLEDVAQERRSMNVPGTGDEARNWSVRLREPLPAILDRDHPRRVWHVITDAMRDRASRGPG